MRSAGLNARPAVKKVKEGIDFIKRLVVHIIKDSGNIVKEKTSYVWKTDKRTKQVIDEPVEFNDHAQDAERYAVFTHLKRSDKIRLRWLE
jgi:phage terminase large subunit